MKNARKQNLSLLLFCTPALIVYILFKLYPALSGVFYSLTNWNGLKKTYDFVGLANFREILTDTYFWNAMGFTFRYVIVMVLVSNVIALTLAVAIESRRRAKGFYRTIFYMPNMISMVIGGYMWMFIFTKVLYYMADNWGWRFLDHSWIGNPRFSFLAIIIVAAWGAVGYLMIIYMAALQGVPANLKEAASIDGANAWQNFWKIVLPLIKPVLVIVVMMRFTDAFKVFDTIYVMTNGGPGTATEMLPNFIYKQGLKYYDAGYAAALAIVFVLVMALITLFFLNLRKKEEDNVW